jgi:hypothetical protein
MGSPITALFCPDLGIEQCKGVYYHIIWALQEQNSNMNTSQN